MITTSRGTPAGRVFISTMSYRVSMLPPDHQAEDGYGIDVEYQGGGRWSITFQNEVLSHRTKQVRNPETDELETLAVWDLDRNVGQDDWWEDHTFEHMDAMSRAMIEAQRIRAVGGMTGAELLETEKENA